MIVLMTPPLPYAKLSTSLKFKPKKKVQSLKDLLFYDSQDICVLF